MTPSINDETRAAGKHRPGLHDPKEVDVSMTQVGQPATTTDGDAETIELLCVRVGELETALHDLIRENLQQDSRRERPALQRADAALFRRGA